MPATVRKKTSKRIKHGVKSEDKTMLTADGFPIVLGETYFFITHGDVLPCTPEPQLNSQLRFEAATSFTGRTPMVDLSYYQNDWEYKGMVYMSLSPKEVFAIATNATKKLKR